jgi:hypothetical protein
MIDQGKQRGPVSLVSPSDQAPSEATTMVEVANVASSGCPSIFCKQAMKHFWPVSSLIAATRPANRSTAVLCPVGSPRLPLDRRLSCSLRSNLIDIEHAGHQTAALRLALVLAAIEAGNAPERLQKIVAHAPRPVGLAMRPSSIGSEQEGRSNQRGLFERGQHNCSYDTSSTRYSSAAGP